MHSHRTREAEENKERGVVTALSKIHKVCTTFKLASMGEIIALIAHQWRQPLSAINGIVLGMDMDERKRVLNREACQENLPNVGRGQIMIDTYLVDSVAFISVEDNGGGVDMQKSKKIFNPYFTTKPEQSGTGLGLYILKLIVEDSMNGRVSLRNGKDGAIFTMEIPIKR